MGLPSCPGIMTRYSKLSSEKSVLLSLTFCNDPFMVIMSWWSSRVSESGPQMSMVTNSNRPLAGNSCRGRRNFSDGLFFRVDLRQFLNVM